MKRTPPPTHASGVSLVELMIALVIGLFLLLGLVQVFAASRTAYQMSEGLARVQENGRFAVDYLQRDIRMAGHFGCVNDQSRLQAVAGIVDPFLSHINPAFPQLAYGVSIQGYEATGTAPGDDLNLATPGTTTWSPALPSFLTTLTPAPRPGSDVILLRYFSGEGVPVTGINSVAGLTTITVNPDPDKWKVLTENGVDKPVLFGLADCTYADVFQATTVSSGTGTIEVKPSGLNNKDFTQRYTASPAGQTMLYRAESVAYYIALGTSGEPALYRARFNADAGAGIVTAVPEELVEGIESMQLLYGQDEHAVDALNGNITVQNTAATLASTETAWRRVGAVQIGLLTRSPAPSAASASDIAPSALGVSFTTPSPNDGRYRTVYESTIALRNRLYGN